MAKIKSNFEKGMLSYQKKEFKNAQGHFNKALVDEGDNLSENTKIYFCLSSIAINDFSELTLKYFDEIIIDESKSLVKKELFNFLQTRDIDSKKLKDSLLFKEFFTKKSFVDYAVLKLSYFTDIKEITENEKLLSQYYMEEKYIFASLYLYSKKYSDDSFIEINTGTIELDIIRTIDVTYFDAVMDMFNTARYVIEKKNINDYSKNYSYNFYEEYNIYTLANEYLGDKNIEKLEECIIQLEKSKTEDPVKIRKTNILKIELSILKDDFELGYASIGNQMLYSLPQDRFVRDLIDKYTQHNREKELSTDQQIKLSQIEEFSVVFVIN